MQDALFIGIATPADCLLFHANRVRGVAVETQSTVVPTGPKANETLQTLNKLPLNIPRNNNDRLLIIRTIDDIRRVLDLA